MFCGIVAGEIPAKIVARGVHCLAFADLNPQAPLHVQVVPLEHVVDAAAVHSTHGALLAEMLEVAATVATDAGFDPAERGYRLVFNVGPDSMSTVPHLHLHVLAGRAMSWPPG